MITDEDKIKEIRLINQLKDNLRHKLSTPLSNIGVFIELCKRANLDDPKLRHLCQVADDSYLDVIKKLD
ncbi:MAG: hypothetical protein HQM16_13985 [Deltaproteobacteria bacterium]|nr:hypothetical protein [Deltaproteobacteria bacterium]